MTTKAQKFAPLPDPPEGTPEDMTNFNQTNITGNAYRLKDYLGNPDTTLVAGEHYMTTIRPSNMAGVRYPDLYVAFGVNPEAYHQNNAYIIEEQGKPPDFVLEIASRSTRQTDNTDKRQEYEALAIPEYWRFDEEGSSDSARLAADRLVDGRYEPLPITQAGPDVLQGYSEILGLIIRWDHGRLDWIDPETEEPIPTIQSEREGRRAEQRGRLAAERERDAERQARLVEQEARLTAEAQLRELRAEMERRNQEQQEPPPPAP